MFIFQAGTPLVTAADTYFILINRAKAENVIWVLGTAATLGARSVVEGSILARTVITFGTKSRLHGCALAQSAMTFESEVSIVLNNYKYDSTGNDISTSSGSKMQYPLSSLWSFLISLFHSTLLLPL
jgi:hypothetical protein